RAGSRTLEFGPEQEFEREIKLSNEIKAERFTSLDRGILRDARENVVVVSATRRHGAAAVLARPPIRTPLLLAEQGPKGRAVAKVIADGLSWRWATPDRALILVSYRSTAL